MIEFSQALEAVLKRTHTLGHKRVSLADSLGYFLAQPLRARLDSPRFSQSAMDGYAVRVSDVKSASPQVAVSLRLTGTSYAGKQSRKALIRGCSIKVMTGAPMPPGANAVVMKEYCEEADGSVLVKRAARLGENVRHHGEEYRRGSALLPAGVCITPPVIGLLASLGQSMVTVHRRPGVTVLVTGDELCKPGVRLRAGEIYDSNSLSLAAALEELGITDSQIVHSLDQESTIRTHIRRALRSSDVVITAGGVSAGDRDLVKSVLENLGVRTVFAGVAIKPGKPIYFGIYAARRGRRNLPATPQQSMRLVFGLPGNPVAALLSFHQLVMPTLLKLMGSRETSPLIFAATLTSDLRKKAGRLQWVRGVLGFKNNRPTVTPTAGQESYMLGGLALAECLIEFPSEQTHLRRGAIVRIQKLEWYR